MLLAFLLCGCALLCPSQSPCYCRWESDNLKAMPGGRTGFKFSLRTCSTCYSLSCLFFSNLSLSTFFSIAHQHNPFVLKNCPLTPNEISPDVKNTENLCFDRRWGMIPSLAILGSPTLFLSEVLGVIAVVLKTWSVNNSSHLIGMTASASSGKWLGKQNLSNPGSIESGSLGMGTSGPCVKPSDNSQACKGLQSTARVRSRHSSDITAQGKAPGSLGGVTTFH